jgi:NDP-sugar pyrophosphorylase family protein
MTNIVALAGDGNRFSVKGFNLPKPLVLVDGLPMVCRAVDSLPKAEAYVFICKQQHIDEYKIDRILTDRYQNSTIVSVERTTRGQACTAELGILESKIDLDSEITISSCDYGLEWNAEKYEEAKKTSDVLVWATTHNKSFSNNPNSYSWLETENNRLVRTHVKKSIFSDPFNHHAIVGTFYFRKARFFLDSLKTIYDHNITTNGEFYIDNIFNSIENLKVNIFSVDNYLCWGTPEDLHEYEN